MKPQFENRAVNFTPFGNKDELITRAEFLDKFVCFGTSLEYKVVGEMVGDNVGGLHVVVDV